MTIVVLDPSHEATAVGAQRAPRSPSLAGKTVGFISNGKEGTKGFFTVLFAAFPDVRFTIRQQLAEGDKVMTHKTFQGTHQGPFMGIPATGKQVAFDVIDIFTVANGKLTEHWAVADLLSLMQHLGAVPTPG